MKLALHHLAKHPRYESILILGGILLLAMVVTFLGILAYILGFDQTQNGLVLSLQAGLMLVSALLLGLPYKTRQVVIIAYTFGFVYLILIALTALIWTDAPSLYLTWLTVFPLLMAFGLSIPALLLGVLLTTVCVFSCSLPWKWGSASPTGALIIRSRITAS
ncbi:MAG: hypothetical protein R3E89_19495 [Thiolinea sp.]